MKLRKYIIFFDNKCGFCSFWINWIARRDRKQLFFFSPLDSNFAHKILGEVDYNSVILYDKGKIYTKSEAIIQILQHLNKFNYIISILLKVFPEKFLDKIYDFIARNRSKLGFRKCNINISAIKNKLIIK